MKIGPSMPPQGPESTGGSPAARLALQELAQMTEKVNATGRPPSLSSYDAFSRDVQDIKGVSKQDSMSLNFAFQQGYVAVEKGDLQSYEKAMISVKAIIEKYA